MTVELCAPAGLWPLSFIATTIGVAMELHSLDLESVAAKPKAKAKTKAVLYAQHPMQSHWPFREVQAFNQ